MPAAGSMTASVWLAPMIPKLPLPLAQRIDRLLQARPGRDTEEHALKLCEAIVAYAACIRVAVAVAVVPAARRAALSRAVGELRDVVDRDQASIANFRDLLLAAAEAIEALEPGHPLGQAELVRPRTTWVARTDLAEALGDTAGVDAAIRKGVVEGGIAGVLDLWVALVEARREVEIDPHGDPWLAPFGDVLVDALSSPALLGEASLTFPEELDDGSLGELWLLHGLEAEPEYEPAARDAYEPGVVSWRFGDQVVSSCGLLSYWLDEHEFDHLGVIVRQRSTAEYLDYGSGARSPASGSSRVAWDRLRVEPVKVERERPSPPVFILAAAAMAVLLVIVGIAWALWPKPEAGGPAPSPSKAAEPIADATQPKPPPAVGPEPEPEIETEIVIEAEPEPESTTPEPGVGRPSTIDGPGPLGEAEIATAALWFESERNLGICQITYDGKTRNANLHLKTRAPEGLLEFSYRCGDHRGQGTIDVKRNRVNGVLFCKKDGAVRVKTVRTNEGRCDR